MNTTKQQYLEVVRANSAYPTYRGFIGIIALLGFLIAAVTALAALVVGLGYMSSSFTTGLAILAVGLLDAAVIFLLARFFKEASLILADIGDATVDAHSRNR